MQPYLAPPGFMASSIFEQQVASILQDLEREIGHHAAVPQAEEVEGGGGGFDACTTAVDEA